MEAKLVIVNKGWAVVSDYQTVFGTTQEEAIYKFKAIVKRHMAILRREHNKKKETLIDG